jgi:transposase
VHQTPRKAHPGSGAESRRAQGRLSRLRNDALPRHAVQRFLRGREADPLPAWIDDAIETDLAPIVRFANTLNRDFDAVKNAVEMPWSNGQAEGQINRLKTLKRAMYGRAGPELLRARMLPFRHTD